MRLSLPAHMHAAGSVAALFDFNLETTPVQLRTILFQTRDPTGRGISSYLVVRVAVQVRRQGARRDRNTSATVTARMIVPFSTS